MEISFLQLKKNLKRSSSKNSFTKLAILGNSPTQTLSIALKGYSIEVDKELEIYEAGYDQIDFEINNPNSKLYLFKPEYVFIYLSPHVFRMAYLKRSFSEKVSLIDELMERVRCWILLIGKNLDGKCKVIINNFYEISDDLFGNYSSKLNYSFGFQIKKFNFLLAELSQELPNFFVVDLSALATEIGFKKLFDVRLNATSNMDLSMEGVVKVSRSVFDIIDTTKGNVKKCIVCDLDNTLWGGVIGDDGIENIEFGDLGIGKAFSDLQYWLKSLKDRGVLLAVCSKNSESIAKEPFEKHPERVLKLEDFAVFMANWNSKVDNIRHIQKCLNIGMSSIVFLDDNPFERNHVRKEIPDICVPELPSDPALFLEYLREQNLFEAGSVSDADFNRAEQYRVEAERRLFLKNHNSIESYLQELQMEAKFIPFTLSDVPRIAQLTQRTNQFNLRTVRMSEDEIRKMIGSDEHYGFSISLKDKFGDSGLVGAIMITREDENVFIDNWMMSCRVFSRGLEQFTMNQLVEFAKIKGIKKIRGEYLFTPKNNIVENIYSELGFKKENGFYSLEVSTYKKIVNYITLGLNRAV